MAVNRALVLLTGATGFLGFLTLIDLLKSGYSVRAAVRSHANSEKIRGHHLVKALNPTSESLFFVVVPDMTVTGAFDAAVRGVDYIVHIASPVPSFGAGEPVAPEQYNKFFVHDELADTATDLRAGRSNSVLLGLLLGGRNEFAYNGNAALATDVARVHVLALDPKVSGSQSFVTSTSIVWEDALEVLRSEFPTAVQAGLLSVDGKQPTQAVNFDGSRTESVLGIKFAPFQELVRQVATRYLELLNKARA